MHDIKAIRDDPVAFDAALERRGLPATARTLLDQDNVLRAAKTALQDMQTRRNDLSGRIGTLMKQGHHDEAQALKDKVASFKAAMRDQEAEMNTAAAALRQSLSDLPNVLAADVPVGRDAAANVEQRRVGTPPSFDFPVKDHVALGRDLGLMDFEAAARLSGSRFVVLKGPLARLERALAAFMLDVHTKTFGYTETYVPQLVHTEALYGTGQLPKFADDLFKLESGHWLIPTAEVSLTNLVAESILEFEDLPVRLTAYTPCFRSEAGAAGKDTHGMIRQHQFSKVELVSIVAPPHADEEHERMTACAQAVLESLELPYRIVTLCAGDTGFSARKTYDIEVWLPGQDAYREISSCSNCGAFQARRMNARYRHPDTGALDYVHTLNGSGLAVGRTLIALMENRQTSRGTIDIPAVLHPYMDGVTSITSLESSPSPGDGNAGQKTAHKRG